MSVSMRLTMCLTMCLWASVVVGLIPLAACSSGPVELGPTFDPCAPIVLVPASDATSAERASLADAVRLWNNAAGSALVMDAAEGAPRVPVLFRDAPLNFLGIYERGSVVINRGLTDDAVRSVVMAHELGHAFGLVHVSDRTSVMVAGNATVIPGPVDVAALAALWGACASVDSQQSTVDGFRSGSARIRTQLP